MLVQNAESSNHPPNGPTFAPTFHIGIDSMNQLQNLFTHPLKNYFPQLFLININIQVFDSAMMGIDRLGCVSDCKLFPMSNI